MTLDFRLGTTNAEGDDSQNRVGVLDAEIACQGHACWCGRILALTP